MSTFKELQDRIAAELRRSNISAHIKNAINDAIDEAAKTRFYFNEITLPVALADGTEEYTHNLVQIDAAYYWINGVVNGQREYLEPINDAYMDDAYFGSRRTGLPEIYSAFGGKTRLYPTPDRTMTLYIKGWGGLTPYPLVNDNDTNAWLTEGERLIRALAKRNVLRDVIRDYGEASALEATAAGIRAELEGETTMRSSSDTLRGTTF